MDGSELSVPVVVLAVLGLVAFLVFKLIQTVKQKAEERRAALRLLGFEPAATAGRDDSALIELCRRGQGDRFRIDNLLERAESDRRILLFDLTDTQDDADRRSLMVVASARLALPRFQLFPRIGSDSRIAALANSLIEKVVAREGHTVSFPEDSAFSRRYTVVGPDEGDLRRFFDRERLARLAEKEGLLIEAAGDSFSVDRLQISGTRHRTDAADVSERVEEAEQLFRLFSIRA